MEVSDDVVQAYDDSFFCHGNKQLALEAAIRVALEAMPQKDHSQKPFGYVYQNGSEFVFTKHHFTDTKNTKLISLYTTSQYYLGYF
jgi:hypothetical protein